MADDALAPAVARPSAAMILTMEGWRIIDYSKDELRQAIIWTNAGILSIRTLGTNFSEISSEIHIFFFIQENAFENIVCEMAVILSLPQCVKTLPHCLK